MLILGCAYMLLKVEIESFINMQKSLGHSVKTIEYYTRNLNLFYEFFGNKEVSEIKDDTFEQYQKWLLEHLNVKKVSIQTYSRAAKAFLRWLHNEGHIDIKLNRLKLVKAEDVIVLPLFDDEVKILLESFSSNDKLELRNKIICLLMVDCGLRRGEVPKIQKKDINLLNRTLLVHGKGAKERLVPLGTLTYHELMKYITITSDNNSNYLLYNKDGRPITENTIKMLFSRLKDRTGITRLYPHLLRHTYATNYILDGGDIETLRILLGHATLEMTQKYVHVAARMKLMINRQKSHVDSLLSKTS